MSDDDNSVLPILAVAVFIGVYYVDGGLVLAAVAAGVATAVWWYSPLPNRDVGRLFEEE